MEQNNQGYWVSFLEYDPGFDLYDSFVLDPETYFEKGAIVFQGCFSSDVFLVYTSDEEN
jgi:hypothetical protein